LKTKPARGNSRAGLAMARVYLAIVAPTREYEICFIVQSDEKSA
jgi:hypothetical protein